MDELSVVLKARALVNKIAPSTIPVPIESYVAEIDAVLHLDDSLGPEEPGWSFPKDGRYHICVNATDRKERQRFTACHEIAHVVLGLPSEHDAAPWWSFSKRSPNEILCDVFAAELLLPYRLFKPIVDKSDISLTAVDALASQFEASTTATGSRFATVAAFPCAFVLAEKGAVRYAARSTTPREGGAWIAPRMQLPAGSACARLCGGGTYDGPEEIEADLWFSDWIRGGTLLEDARHLGQWDQTIALLWFDDEELPAPREARQQDEQGLAELDGILPWPEKRRRR